VNICLHLFKSGSTGCDLVASLSFTNVQCTDGDYVEHSESSIGVHVTELGLLFGSRSLKAFNLWQDHFCVKPSCK
jgi:hypothetical protein